MAEQGVDGLLLPGVEHPGQVLVRLVKSMPPMYTVHIVNFQSEIGPTLISNILTQEQAKPILAALLALNGTGPDGCVVFSPDGPATGAISARWNGCEITIEHGPRGLSERFDNVGAFATAYGLPLSSSPLDQIKSELRARLLPGAQFLPKYIYSFDEQPHQSFEYSMTLPTPPGPEEYHPTKDERQCLDEFLDQIFLPYSPR